MSEPGGDPPSGISSGDALILPERHPAYRRREARPGFRMERENLCFVTPPGVKGQAASGSNREGESTEAERRGGAARSSDEGPVMGLERRGCVVRPWPLANWKREEPVDEAKPFKATVEHREPCDSRGSCTVLGAPGGEIPPGDSTRAAVIPRLMVRPVCPQLRKCRVRPGGYALCHKRTSLRLFRTTHAARPSLNELGAFQ